MQYSDYYIVIKDTNGVKQEELYEFDTLQYTRKVNEAGLLITDLIADNPKAAALEIGGQLEVKRRNVAMGLDWYTDFVGLIRAFRYTNQNGIDRLRVTADEALSLLDDRIIAYNPDVTNRTRFNNVRAETIMKNLVRYNITASGTVADGRVRLATPSAYTITIQTDAGQGNLLSIGDVTYDSLLLALQEIANIAGGDFDLIQTGNTTFDFRFYNGQRGTDRTNTVVFSLENANLTEPVYEISTLNEKTVGIVAGQGQGVDRDIVVVNGVNYASNNNRETFINASQVPKGNIASLTATGEKKLYDLREKVTFDFKVIQSPSTFYGIDFFIGDLVTAKFRDLETVQKVMGVTITYSRNNSEKEQIDFQLQTIG